MVRLNRCLEVKMLLSLAGLSLAGMGLAAPGIAYAAPAETQALTPAEKATEAALLARLIERRAQIVASSAAEADKRHALEFLDRQIARAKGRSGR